MRILIEGHHYQKEDIETLLEGSGINPRYVEGDTKYSLDHVGYYYNHKVGDCVFILPKVIVDEQGRIDESLSVEDLMHIDKDEQNEQKQHVLQFVYGFSVWMYRAISVYREKNPDSDIAVSSNITQMGKGKRRDRYTFLDVILELLQFNRDNREYLTFIVKNQHRGLNKINWTRTISKSQAIIQDESLVYLNPANRKRGINFDEELLIIYYSILEYIHQQYGFHVNINTNFELIKGERFEAYKNGMGCTRLRQIKYKYFSDKALRIWELCFAFFDNAYKICIHSNVKDYLLVHDFHEVFEDMFDELIGDTLDKDLEALKTQEDGKQLDHLYRYYGLTHRDNSEEQIYYIGDSKYYPRGASNMGVKPISKQYTYARNLIQYNLNLFFDEQNGKKRGKYYQKYRDMETEGYDVVPNFFISARIDQLDSSGYSQNRITPKDVADGKKFYVSRHFENRLFDRDTILIAHYDVNFLYVIALYSRDNTNEKQGWKDEVREKFRQRIREGLNDTYTFYAMTPREGVNSEEFFKENFQQLLGKVYTPYNIGGPQPYYSLALDKDPKYDDENDLVLALIEPFFNYKECPLGEDPRNILPQMSPTTMPAISTSLLTKHFIERYPNQHFLIGCYHSDEQLDWILGKNDKGTNLYNVRLKRRGDNTRDGALRPKDFKEKNVVFVVLYKFDERNKNEYRVFHVHHNATMNEERMRKSLYPNPQGNYFCFVFDEEVQLSQHIDISKIITDAIDNDDIVPGTPIFKTGIELHNYLR
ncbi:MAG: restriction endonuclease [Bacteroidales bacterium]|nr:restriction endonuclease [Bacteroidales bacterium]